MKKNIEINAGTLYDMNKQLMNNKEIFKPMSHMELAAVQLKLTDWFKERKYAMLLCNDIHYFTLFHLNHEPESFTAAVTAAAQCIGCLTDQNMDILSIELQEDNTWEIWLRDKDESLVFYLFDYEKGVLEC